MPAAAGEPPRQLKGFQKLVLAPGETRCASIVLDTRSFEHWDTNRHDWIITPARYQIEVGAPSRDILLQGSIMQ